MTIKQNIYKISLGLTTAVAINMSVASNVMANEPFVAEIRQFPYNFCPRGWAETNGQLLQISQNTALFSLIGTIYGGDGRTTMRLPNLQGRVAKHSGNGPGIGLATQGQTGGADTFTLNTLLRHNHSASTETLVNVSTADGNSPSPDGVHFADDGRDRIYNAETPDLQLSEQAVVSVTQLDAAGSNSPLPINRAQPNIAMRYCIALVGVYPSRS